MTVSNAASKSANVCTDKEVKFDNMKSTRAADANIEAVIMINSSIGLINIPEGILMFFFISRKIRYVSVKANNSKCLSHDHDLASCRKKHCPFGEYVFLIIVSAEPITDILVAFYIFSFSTFTSTRCLIFGSKEVAVGYVFPDAAFIFCSSL